MDRTPRCNLIAWPVGLMTSPDWTPHCQSVELVMNGKHVGNYLLIEQIRADSNRVPCEDGFWNATSTTTMRSNGSKRPENVCRCMTAPSK